VGLVVQKIPFGSKVCLFGAEVVIRVSKSFDSGTENWVGTPYAYCPFPDDFSYVEGFGTGGGGGRRVGWRFEVGLSGGHAKRA